MATLQTSGAISILNIKNLFGGPASPSLANYYRGGSYIPATKTVSSSVREPSSGDYYTPDTTYVWFWFQTGNRNAYWAGGLQATGIPQTGSVTVGSITYYSGTLYYDVAGSYGTRNQKRGIYRTYTGSSTVSINTGVPSSGTIRLSNFYGAEKP